MSRRMTVTDFLEFVTKAASGAPADAWVRINGEYLTNLSVMLQKPLIEELTDDSQVVRLKPDKTARDVFDISANDRQPEELPIPRIDRRTW